jgi:hypothetical protein
MDSPKMRLEVKVIVDRLLKEYSEMWRLLAAYDNGTLTKEEAEGIEAAMEQPYKVINAGQLANKEKPWIPS